MSRMSRKQFIISNGATCRNWSWSWSFVNIRDKVVIFGDFSTRNKKEPILSHKWKFTSKGRRSCGYKQAIEHVRLIEEEGYQLKTFHMEFSREGNGPVTISDFVPKLTPRTLTRQGDDWYAVD